jgi:hypothetical protein
MKGERTDHYCTIRSYVGAQKERLIDDGEEAALMALKEWLCDGHAYGGQSVLSS